MDRENERGFVYNERYIRWRNDAPVKSVVKKLKMLGYRTDYWRQFH